MGLGLELFKQLSQCTVKGFIFRILEKSLVTSSFTFFRINIQLCGKN